MRLDQSSSLWTSVPPSARVGMALQSHYQDSLQSLYFGEFSLLSIAYGLWIKALCMTSEGVSEAAVEGGGEGGVGPTDQEGKPSMCISASCPREARAGIHLPFCELCFYKLSGVGWEQQVQEMGDYQVRKDFWQFLVVSEGWETG